MENQIKVELQDWLGNDRAIADSAWTSSFDKSKRDSKDDKEVTRIVNMLADSGHGVPFESIVFRFWLKIPIFTDRQIQTHRIMSSNGLSGRYRTLPDDYFKIPDDVKDLMKKVETVNPLISNNLTSNLEYMIDASIQAYKDMIYFAKLARDEKIITNEEYKRIREIARGVIPTALMTERTITINLRSFANFMKLRFSPHAQPEIQQVARMMLQQVKDNNVCPVAIEALEKNQWVI